MKQKESLLLIVLLIISHILPAQNCQGNLGNPVAKITFGAGTNPGPAINAGKTSYRYSASDCPLDGSYIVRTRTDSCFNWHTLNTDHTGDRNGYFMIFNASLTPGAFYVDTVELARNNTIYQFAAWVMNMNSPSECDGKSILPNLTFTIEKVDGTILKSFNAGDIPTQTTPTWQQINFSFTTSSVINKAVIKIKNNTPGGCGNDIALDDITFRPCVLDMNENANGGVFVPTAFTPNGDGKNDKWEVIGLNINSSYDITIFNRWGQVVYYSKNASTGWDGTYKGMKVPVGSYPYMIKVQSENKVLKGILTVIR